MDWPVNSLFVVIIPGTACKLNWVMMSGLLCVEGTRGKWLKYTEGGLLERRVFPN